jgi:hypothetical protein
MTHPDFDELVDVDVSPEERARLSRVHEALIAAGPPPELSPALARPPGEPVADVSPMFPKYPRRRLAATVVLAAALALAAFGGGYLLGSDEEFETTRVVRLHGTDAAPGAIASIRLGQRDSGGNWPMVLVVQGLKPLPGAGYYELYLVRDGRPLAACGSFDVEGQGQTRIRLSVAYDLERFDGWVVTKHVPPAPAEEEPLLTT